MRPARLTPAPQPPPAASHPRTGRRGRSKYGNVPTVVDGIRFASKAEARRWSQLRLLQDAGHISLLVRQPRFKLEDCTYVGDFAYVEGFQAIVEDVKGAETAVFKMKAKAFRRLYPEYELRIIKA